MQKQSPVRASPLLKKQHGMKSSGRSTGHNVKVFGGNMTNPNPVDMLVEGNNKLLKKEHHAYQKASRKRIAKGKEAIAIRKKMANSLSRHINLNLKEKGEIWE